MTSSPADDLVETTERGRISATETSWALRLANRSAAGVDHALAGRLGLRPLDYAALTHLFGAAPGELGPHDLSARLGISTGSATELVDRLERAGHLERRRLEHDRRRVGLHLTDATVQRVLAELGELFRGLDHLGHQFSEPEQAIIVRYLRGAAALMADFSSA